MPLILSIETSTKVCSVALHKKGEIIGLSELFLSKSHSTHLVPMIKELLNQCKIKGSELSAIAISGGPGSYTGLRIGSSTAKGLAYGYDIPLIAVNTIKALALGLSNIAVDNEYIIIPLLDARRMEVYTGIYNQNLKILQEVHPEIIDENSFKNWLSDSKVLFGGNAVLKCKNVIDHQNAIFVDSFYTSARFVGELAYEKWKNNELEDTAYFEPDYLKEFQTKRPKKRL